MMSTSFLNSPASRAELHALMQVPDTSFERLYDLVSEIVETDPYEADGKRWAARPQAFYVDHLGISVETVRRLIKDAPFIRSTRQVMIVDGVVKPKKGFKNGINMTLLRLGLPGDTDDKKLKNTMSKMWREKMGKPVTHPNNEFGPICGCLEVWPKEHAIEIFKLVLNNWPTFMSGAKFIMDELEAKGEGKVVYLEYLNIKVIRRFASVGLEMWMMQQQAKNQW